MNSTIINTVTNFLKKRTLEFAGLLLITVATLFFIALITYAPDDPSLISNKNKRMVELKNWLNLLN